jgi:palmitoyl-protein thioesterase
MDKKGKLVFIALAGDHLQFTDQWFVDNIVQKYLR